MFWPALAIITALCLVRFNQSDNTNFEEQGNCVSEFIITTETWLCKINPKTNSLDKGPYRLQWRKYETCKGPKQGECGKVEIQNTQNMSDVIFSLDFPKDCPITKARVTTGTLQKNNNTRKLWNYALDKPCQHFVLGPILVESFNLSSSCKIKKGQYTVHLNMAEKAKMFLGSNFFYGIYVFNTMAFNSVSNFFCVQAILEAERL